MGFLRSSHGGKLVKELINHLGFHPKHLLKIEKAIKNGWPLRPVKNYAFNNLQNRTGTKIDDLEHILKSPEDLLRFPHGTTAVAIIPKLIPNFICLDFDHEDETLQEAVFSILRRFASDLTLCMRQGSKTKLGQFWFKLEAKTAIELEKIKIEKLDIIAQSKRCDALGNYKGNDSCYEYPFLQFWDIRPEELPEFKIEMFDEIRQTIEAFYPESPKAKIETGSQHDFLLKFINAKIFDGEHPVSVYQDVLSSNAYEDMCSRRKTPAEAKNEILRMFAKPIEQYLKNEDFWRLEKPDHPENVFSESHPKCEKESFLDMLYQICRRNQRTNADKMAFFTALSLCGWILSLNTRLYGMCPNLMILYVARSGSGKSSTSSLLKEFVSEFDMFHQSFGDGVIKTKEAFFRGFEESPTQMYVLDEYTKLLKSKTGNNSHTVGLTESMCQYYSDYSDNTLCRVSISEYSYGVCYGPKLNTLMFTTPEFKQHFTKQEFLSGMGRRTLTVFDESIHLQKKNKKEYPFYFSNGEKAKIRKFLEEFVYTDESFLTKSFYQEVDVSQKKIKKQVKKKTDSEFYEHIKKHVIKNQLKYDEETLFYMQNDHIDKANNLKINAAKTASLVDSVISNGFTEFTIKLAAIHALCGRKVPSKIVQMQDIEWAEKTFLLYMSDSFSEDAKNLFDTDSDKVILLAQKLYEKLLEGNVKTFTAGEKMLHNFFRAERKKLKQECIDYLKANNKIQLMNEEASKRSYKYKVLS